MQRNNVLCLVQKTTAKPRIPIASMNDAVPGVARRKSVSAGSLRCVCLEYVNMSPHDGQSASMLLSPQFWMKLAMEPSIEPSL
jgi:hypothetical protein